MKYIRFQTAFKAKGTNKPCGIFSAIHKLRAGAIISDEDWDAFSALDQWFIENLPMPPFGNDGNPKKAITWFKESSSEMIRKAKPLLSMLEKYGISAEMITVDDPGTIIYEDEWQVGTVDEVSENRNRGNRMYDEFAELWPLISVPEEYEKEAGYWRAVLQEKLGPGRHDILELGAGGGHNLSHLTKDFNITATDLSEHMLKNCRELNPGVPTCVGDMRSLRLNRTFKAVLAHDAISCMLSKDDLRKVFSTAAAHLEPGGCLVIAPDHYRETFHSPRIEHTTNSDGNTELTLIEYQYDPDPSDTTTETLMIYIIRTDSGLRVEKDNHRIGLFPLQMWIDLMQEAGFIVEKYPYPVHDDGRPSYLLTGTWVGDDRG